MAICEDDIKKHKWESGYKPIIRIAGRTLNLALIYLFIEKTNILLFK